MLVILNKFSVIIQDNPRQPKLFVVHYRRIELEMYYM